MPNIASAGWARSRTAGRGGHRIEYIAVHYTATRASANANCRYFASRATGASAHYFIDGSGTIWQSVPDGDTAYAVGNWNANQRSVSIEVVSAGEDFSEAEIAELAWLTQRLMRQYGVPASKVVRHYDFASIGFPGSWASPHKLCPRPYIDAAKWSALHARITGGAVAETPAPAPSRPAPKPSPLVHVRYGLRVLGGGWLDEVTDFGAGDDGFAGYPNRRHDLFYARVDSGTLRYRSHVVGGGWLDWVSKGDRNDTVHGCAGIPGKAIDGVQLYYVTPAGESLKQAWYRSQTTARAGWLPVCCDDGTSYKQFDSWCGILGEPLDRIQIAITDGNPF